MKLIFIDVETTGTYIKSGLIQLSGIVEIDNVIMESFDYKIKPFDDDIIIQEALDVNKITREELSTFENPVKIFKQFESLLSKYIDRFNKKDKFHFIGYNAKFDDDHIRSWFKKNNNNFYGSWFFVPPIDVMQMAAFHLMNVRHTLPNFKLETVCRAMNMDIDSDKTHDAMYDIELTRNLFYILKERINTPDIVS